MSNIIILGSSYATANALVLGNLREYRVSRSLKNVQLASGYVGLMVASSPD